MNKEKILQAMINGVQKPAANDDVYEGVYGEVYYTYTPEAQKQAQKQPEDE